jgi:hypothetical protein
LGKSPEARYKIQESKDGRDRQSPADSGATHPLQVGREGDETPEHEGGYGGLYPGSLEPPAQEPQTVTRELARQLASVYPLRRQEQHHVVPGILRDGGIKR